MYEDAERDLPQCAPSSAASATQSVSESQTLASGMQWCVCVCVCVCVCARMQGETYHNVLLHRLRRPRSRSVSRRRWPVECSGACVCVYEDAG